MKRLIIVAMLLLSVAVLSGCTKILMRIAPDGAGSWQLGLQIDPEALEALDESGDTDNELLDEALAGAVQEDAETGITVRGEVRLENGKRWIYIIADVPNLEAWSQIEAVNERLSAEDEAETDEESFGPEVEVSEETFFYPTITIEGNTVRMEISGPPPVEFVEEDEFGLSVLFLPSYEVEMPGTVTDTNGEIDSLTGNPVFFIDPTSTEPLFFYAESTLE